MNLKSVLLSAPIRVAGSPASKKWEADVDTLLTVEPPFIVVGVRKDGILYRVGVPAVSVQQVELVEETEPSMERIRGFISRETPLPPEGFRGASVTENIEALVGGSPVTPDEASEQINAGTQPKGKKGKG